LEPPHERRILRYLIRPRKAICASERKEERPTKKYLRKLSPPARPTICPLSYGHTTLVVYCAGGGGSAHYAAKRPQQKCSLRITVEKEIK
jgi:hypothetical protein